MNPHGPYPVAIRTHWTRTFRCLTSPGVPHKSNSIRLACKCFTASIHDVLYPALYTELQTDRTIYKTSFVFRALRSFTRIIHHRMEAAQAHCSRPVRTRPQCAGPGVAVQVPSLNRQRITAFRWQDMERAASMPIRLVHTDTPHDGTVTAI